MAHTGCDPSPASDIFFGGGESFMGRGRGSETLALLLLSPSFEPLLVPVHRPVSAPTPGQWLPAGSGKDSTTKLALVNLKFKINLTERAVAQAPRAILAKQHHFAGGAFLEMTKPQLQTTQAPKPRLSRGRGRSGQGQGQEQAGAGLPWSHPPPGSVFFLAGSSLQAGQAPSPPAKAAEFHYKNKIK